MPASPGAAPKVLPPVYITAHHFGRIEHFAHIELPPGHAARDVLIEKLARAKILRSEDMPKDTVTMNTRVLLTVDDGEQESRLLVYPEGYYPTGQYISLGSPLGAALLGLSAGSQATYVDHQGAVRDLRVERVTYQPEANEASWQKLA